MFTIIEIQKEQIFAYVDDTFMLFNRHKLLTGAKEVGVLWAAGKCSTNPLKVPTETIPKDSCYHHMLVTALIKRVEETIPAK
jgi:hypothetical protein